MIKCEAWRAFYRFFCNEFNKFNNVRFYLSNDIKITLKSHFLRKTCLLCHYVRKVVMDVFTFLENL